MKIGTHLEAINVVAAAQLFQSAVSCTVRSTSKDARALTESSVAPGKFFDGDRLPTEMEVARYLLAVSEDCSANIRKFIAERG